MHPEIARVERAVFVKARLGRRRMGVLAAAMIAAVAVLAPGLTRPASAAPPSGEYIVTLKDGINANAFAAAADARSGVEVKQVYSVALEAFHARLTASAKAQLAQDLGVRFVSPNRTFKAAAQVLPTGVDRIEGDLSTVVAAGASVTTPVAVLDTGVTPGPDLNVQAIGQNCVGGVGWSDLNGHGTHIAGILGANNNADGVVGVAPGAPIYPIQVLDRSANGSDASIFAASNGSPPWAERWGSGWPTCRPGPSAPMTATAG
jgi:subtilisin